jgi:hypothetical protein
VRAVAKIDWELEGFVKKIVYAVANKPVSSRAA